VLVTLEVKPPQAGRAGINSIGPFERTWTGTYFSDVPVSVRVQPTAPGWIFSHWESDGEPLLYPDSSSFSQKLGSNTHLTAYFAIAHPDGTSVSATVSPNPSSDLVFVQATEQLGTCVLTNEQGQEQYRFETSQLRYVFSVADLLPGVYFLKAAHWPAAQRLVVTK
jgi:hypothetical protein